MTGPLLLALIGVGVIVMLIGFATKTPQTVIAGIALIAVGLTALLATRRRA